MQQIGLYTFRLQGLTSGDTTLLLEEITLMGYVGMLSLLILMTELVKHT